MNRFVPLQLLWMATWKRPAKLNWIYLKQEFAVPQAAKEVVVPKRTLKYSLLSACVLALAGSGDSFLYIYLPANYQSLGLSVFWVGVLLSINRFTRLILNSHIAYYLSAFGLRTITIAVTIIATLTTFFYGFADSVFL